MDWPNSRNNFNDLINNKWIVLDTENLRSYKLAAYNIQRIFHKWDILLDVIKSASNKKMIFSYPDFQIYFNEDAFGYGKEKFSKIGLHLIGKTMSIFKHYHVIRNANINAKERHIAAFSHILEEKKIYFFHYNDDVMKNDFKRIEEREEDGINLKSYAAYYINGPSKSDIKPFYFQSN